MYPTQPQAQFGGPVPARQNWWGRNWKWVVPVGCLGLVLAVVGFVAAIVLVAMSAVKSTEVYREAYRRARTDPKVVEELGEPVKDGWFVKGTVRTSGGGGFADFEFPVSGPKNSGTVYAQAAKVNGEWEFRALEVSVKGLRGRHSLLEPPTPPDAPGAKTNGGPPAPPPPGAATVISGGLLNSKALSKPQPPYPAAARAVQAQGEVAVQVVVDESGRVISASAVTGHPLLQQAAVAAARHARFSPTTLSGKPARVSGVLTYNFTLE